MRTLAISHQRDAGPGVFAEAIAAAGAELDVWHIAESDDPPADPFGYDAVLSFGGAMHADQEGDHGWIAPEKSLLTELLDARVPLLGVCLGAQLLAAASGGRVARSSQPEIGWHDVQLTDEGVEDPHAGAARSRLRGVPVAQLRVLARPRLDAARAKPGMRTGFSSR